MKFPHYYQRDQMDCGPTCLRMIAMHYGRRFAMEELRSKARIKKGGVSLLGISDAAEEIGFRTLGVKVPFRKLVSDVQLPCIVHWNQRHFVVVYKIKKDKIFIADPVAGLLTYKETEFLKCWLSIGSNGSSAGIALLLEPTPLFYEVEAKSDNNTKKGFEYIWGYIRSYQNFILKLILGMLLGSLIQLIFPFLTQLVVDVGIKTKDISFIYIILAAQLMLFFSRTVVDFFRRWILLHLSTRINLSIVSDFLIKLMRLPISFFDSKNIGDILQRIEDHSRIESFISSSSLSILFSFFNLIVYSIILYVYNVPIFIIFFAGSIVYGTYVVLFLKLRKKLDYKRFNVASTNKSSLIQLINGMQEIKLHNCTRSKRWEWERIQAKKFHVNVGSIRLQQWQEGGSMFINELKNILITFVAATAVINEEMSLGMLLAAQYIIGSLNGPINDFVNFTGKFQDARISLDRIGEIHTAKDEDLPGQKKLGDSFTGKDLKLENLMFQYDGDNSPKAIEDINLTIESGKVTAIVGMSGSGKTTLLKLLLKFYKPVEGRIFLGQTDLESIQASSWRDKCGVVMHDGFIFSDSIAKNICVDEEIYDREHVISAAKMANIDEFIDELPLGYETVIGANGIGLSKGQRQRLFIARAIYKDPEYLFFDEATNSLDTKNEKVINDNLLRFFHGRTVLVIAHRLSTVRHADKIIVMEEGKIVEEGNHSRLYKNKGVYYELVKNQLELTN